MSDTGQIGGLEELGHRLQATMQPTKIKKNIYIFYMFLTRKLQEFDSKYMSNTNICYIFMGLTFVVPYYLKVFVTVLPYLGAILYLVSP